MIQQLQFDSALVILGYYIPVLVCLVGYTCETVQEYSAEVARALMCRERNIGYNGNLTVGVILYRIIGTVLPVVNIGCILFDIGWPMLRYVNRTINSIMGIPLVKPHKSTTKRV